MIIRKFQRLNDGSFPNNSYVRRFSHSINGLITEVIDGYETEYIGHNEIIGDMLSFFSEFAISIRYYNLDSLTREIEPEKNPLVLWARIQEKIVEQHYRGKKYTEFEEEIIDGLEDAATFMFTDMNGNMIRGAREFFERGKEIETIQSYSVFYIHRIMVDIVKIIQEEEEKYYTIPVMSEFFPFFRESSFTKQQILKKKRWEYR